MPRFTDDMPRRQSGQGSGLLILVLGVIGLIFVLLVLHTLTGYWLQGVGSTEVGIQMHAGQPVAVVGPGNYTDIQPFASLQRVNVSAIPFTATDPEVLTNDSQRIGVTMQATVRRPGQDRSDVLMTQWSRFSVFYTDDTALVGSKDTPGLMQNLSNQAMKVCVGNSAFNDVAIGAGRDKLRQCIDSELGTLGSGYNLTVENVVVPNITLSKQVQDSLDAITKSRYDNAVAEQNKITAAAQADAVAAQTSGQIRSDAAKVQEQAKQDAVTADLNQKALAAQYAVIEQQKANDLYSAQQEVAIQQAKADAAMQAARASQASEQVLAAIYQSNPAYANLKVVEAQASAYKQTDKVIVPAGTNPNLIIGDGTTPVVQTQTGH